jgi:hypothetical protein
VPFSAPPWHFITVAVTVFLASKYYSAQIYGGLNITSVNDKLFMMSLFNPLAPTIPKMEFKLFKLSSDFLKSVGCWALMALTSLQLKLLSYIRQ